MKELQSQAVLLRIGILFQVSQRRKRGNDVVHRRLVVAQHGRHLGDAQSRLFRGKAFEHLDGLYQ